MYGCACVLREASPAWRRRARPSNVFLVYDSGSTIDMKRASGLSFPKERRLTRASEYERVKREGLVWRGKLLILNTARIANSGVCRMGFITSRRLGSAVIRNRVRRRLREILRQRQHDLKRDFWIVLIARRDAANASYRALEDEWLRLVRRASILL